MSVRTFWLKSDKKTVQEVAKDAHILSWKTTHVVRVHSNGELYTNRNWIRGKQFRQIIALCAKECGVEK